MVIQKRVQLQEGITAEFSFSERARMIGIHGGKFPFFGKSRYQSF
jgi:hypothetical protein